MLLRCREVKILQPSLADTHITHTHTHTHTHPYPGTGRLVGKGGVHTHIQTPSLGTVVGKGGVYTHIDTHTLS